MPGKSTILPNIVPALCSLLFLPLSMHASASVVFHIDCPPDSTVDCGTELWDLMQFGEAKAHTYDGPVHLGEADWVERHLNDCGTGYIERTWIAHDYQNNPYYCTQAIYISSNENVQITWPENLVIESCSADTDPEDLTPPYDQPIISEDGCSQIMVSYEDADFKIYGSADCRKILRKWTVIDWCNYDGSGSYAKGIWEHTQIIKIVAPAPPTLSCPNDITVTADQSCIGGYVQMTPVIAESACASMLEVTNNSPYADAGGAVASGYYPIGTTEVVFKVDDQCGEQLSCVVYITIEDLKTPTPICHYGISLTLMPMEAGPAFVLQPEFFDKGSYDNCTPTDKLEMRVEPGIVTCADVGPTEVKLIVTDESGNSAYCYTMLNVQDNGDDCPDQMAQISGRLITADGTKLPDKLVMLLGYGDYRMTDNAGEYTFQEVPAGQEYEVAPDEVQDDLDGITTLDLLVTLKHILGIAQLDDPYMSLAADIDRSGDITVNDLIQLKELILKKHHNMKVSTVWRYVDAQYPMQDMAGNLNQLPSSYYISALDADMKNIDFVGVKVGDVSGEINMPASRSRGPVGSLELDVTMMNIELIKPGESFRLKLRPRDGISVAALQMTLHWDSELAHLEGLKMPDGKTAIFDYVQLDDHVRIIWFDTDLGPSKSSGDFLTLYFKANAALPPGTALVELLDNERELPALAYKQDYSELAVTALNYPANTIDTQSEDMQIGMPFPNPCVEQTTIPVSLAQDQKLTVEIFDGQGQLVGSEFIDGHAGEQRITVDAKGRSGLLVCRIRGQNTIKNVRIVSQSRD